MPTITPVVVAAGFAAAAAAALTLPQAMFPTEAKPSTASVLSASFAPSAPELPAVKTEERLLPSDPSNDDGTNGCGMMKGVDVCSPGFMKSYLEYHLAR